MICHRLQPLKSRTVQSLLVVGLATAAGLALAVENRGSLAPPLSEYREIKTLELSRPLPLPLTPWLDPDEVTLPEKSPLSSTEPRLAEAGAGSAAGDKLQWRSPSPGDLAGAFAAPGAPTDTPEPGEEAARLTVDEPDDSSIESRRESPVAELPPSDPEQSVPSTGAEAEEPPPAAKPLAPLSRSQIALRDWLRKVLGYYYARPLNSQDHDCWEIMHGMLAFELYSKIRDGGPRGEPITAVGHLCYNRPCKRKQMLQVTPEGEIDVRVGVGLQGHKGQLLALLAQCNVTPDYPMLIDGKELTIHDLIRSEQKTCYAKTELTFKLIGLMHYLPSDATWINDQGESWDIPRLIREELEQPIRGAACGGTHRLSGLTLAARKRVGRGQPLEGDWLLAAQFIDKYEAYAYRLQNRDGSLSTEWFRGPGSEASIDRRVKTTGHILEWLLYAATDEQLTSAPTVRAVSYLTNLLASNSSHQWEIGPLCHALHALVIYDKRVFQPYDNQQPVAGEATPRSPSPSARRPLPTRSR